MVILTHARLARRLASRARFSTASHHTVPLSIHSKVQEALSTHKPIVALETTLVTHGFLYPTNYTRPRRHRTIHGVCPGYYWNHRGTRQDREGNPGVVKVPRRDIAPVFGAKMDGGTTCSARLIFVALAGIKVFATGGLGGVHRGAQDFMQWTSQLTSLSSPVVQSVLCLRGLNPFWTLEVTYGKSREFPAFFTRSSEGDTQWQFGMDNGILIAAPIPEEHEKEGSSIQKAVDQAVRESEENGMSKRGKEVTPWLLYP
ncbi:uncharacterized protein EV420DRAFT_1484047 [Desarmillaria tabescens]|uniref:Uncharacterized protein n=1 Tax=Armillaria tabescens TaxID=1929756 RepID=A0AA39MUL0_ARMTA|nr:uncharacterized protein EV420DRAFT_1484047 [Desarmillaria tabescens]KAK0446390.1 hypothetical protein EV420DRAFT_1484047 [Desarmillaria tabescens]